ncbi:MAG: S1 RNA-binding domain-containing protein [bacterium]|nr:S1 RNA-binding domain-containing protein [bacterium]
MEEIMREEEFYKDAVKPIREGEIIEGVVVKIDPECIFVDIGCKSEGIVPLNESGGKRKDIKVGDRISVFVLKTEDRVVLSKKRADLEKSWSMVERAFETGEIIEARVLKVVKGGLLISLGSIFGFLPAAHLEKGFVKDLKRYVNKLLRLKVLEVNRRQNRVILSQKVVLEEEDRKRKEALLDSLSEGEIRKGSVSGITSFGVFVDLGGIDGLVRKTELSYNKVNHPKEVISKGAEVDVKVLKFNRKEGKISLSIKQALPDPWDSVDKKFSLGQIVKGKVVNMTKACVFVELEPGIDGLIPLRELGKKGIGSPRDVVKIGDEVSAKILEIVKESKRIILSIRRIFDDEERNDISRYLNAQKRERLTLGEIIKEKLENSGKKIIQEAVNGVNRD